MTPQQEDEFLNQPIDDGLLADDRAFVLAGRQMVIEAYRIPPEKRPTWSKELLDRWDSDPVQFEEVKQPHRIDGLTDAMMSPLITNAVPSNLTLNEDMHSDVTLTPASMPDVPQESQFNAALRQWIIEEFMDPKRLQSDMKVDDIGVDKVRVWSPTHVRLVGSWIIHRDGTYLRCPRSESFDTGVRRFENGERSDRIANWPSLESNALVVSPVMASSLETASSVEIGSIDSVTQIARLVTIDPTLLQQEEIDEEGTRIWSDQRPDIGEYLVNQDGSFLHLAPGEDLGPSIVKYFQGERSGSLSAPPSETN